MSKPNFKVGDKVVIKDWDEMVKEYGIATLSRGSINCYPYYFASSMRVLCGEEATITKVYLENWKVELKFKKSNLNHSPWNYCMDMIKHAKPQTIVIYQKDNRVIAKDKTTNRTAAAICSPEDEFNFKIGASIAFERLVGRDLIDKARKVVDAAKEEKRKEIEIGNSVRIINANKQATKEISFFKENNIDFEFATKYRYGSLISWTEFDDDFEVVAIGYNSQGNKMCVIRNKSKGISSGYYLFSIDGLEKC